MPQTQEQVKFLATLDRRTQDKDGEWKIVLLAPASEDTALQGLSRFFGEMVVSVTIQQGEPDGDQTD